ncbi:MAG: UrcA family protein [Gammaproteobacteria bacterium]|nr:UrcA family protein [Gammaproteobacteria bacterium]MDE2250430.1 UrcA family protein [Gammaproteobacteria bacterium]
MDAARFTRLAGPWLLALGATIAQAALVSTASAGAPAGDVTVRFSDLDLSRRADVARLYQRIRAAARASCGAEVLTGSHLLNAGQQRCVDEAVEAAVAKVHNEQLSAFHQTGPKRQQAATRAGSAARDSVSGPTRGEHG